MCRLTTWQDRRFQEFDRPLHTAFDKPEARRSRSSMKGETCNCSPTGFKNSSESCRTTRVMTLPANRDTPCLKMKLYGTSKSYPFWNTTTSIVRKVVSPHQHSLTLVSFPLFVSS
mmetsp:Transcript_29441/g.43432  ORF Transcript_29441/g.43432 Transcript_29441/m.43432 type:complete len:115 (+) Transcript_29441:251-595(+)